jgi:hypothetical protein
VPLASGSVGDAGESVKTSPHAIDQKHREFHDECADPDYGMRDAQMQLALAFQRVLHAMDWIPSTASFTFQRRQFIYKPENRRKDTDDTKQT